MTGVDLKTAGIVGLAVAAPSLMRLGKSAGAANTAAWSALPESVAGVSFQKPPGGNMSDCWAAMWRAMAARDFDDDRPALRDIADAWLAAYRAGAAASARDYSLITDELDHMQAGFGGDGWTDPDVVCNSDTFTDAFRTELGRAVCQLHQSRALLGSGIGFAAGAIDTAQLRDETERLAAAMDAADFRAAGTRRSDRTYAGLLDAPFVLAGYVGSAAARVLGSAAGAVIGSPMFLALVAGLVIWRLKR